MALNYRENLFVANYIKLGEAYPAAIEAGYAESTAKEASKWINIDTLKNPNEKERKKFKPEVYAAIMEEMEKIKKTTIAEASEVLEYLTSVMRREHKEVAVVTTMEKRVFYAPDEKGTIRKNEVTKETPVLVEYPAKLSDANRAADLLGRRWGLWDKKQDTETEQANDGFLEALRGEADDVWREE